MCMPLEEIKACFTDVDTYLSKESRVLDIYISCLEDMEYLDCDHWFTHLQGDFVSIRHFQAGIYSFLGVIKRHTVALSLAKYTVVNIYQ